MRAARGEEDEGTKHADAPAVVLPTPATQSTGETILEIDHFGACRPDPAPSHAILIDTVVKLHEDRIVEWIVILRLPANPQAITNTSLRRELHLDESSRTRQRVRELRRTSIGIVQTRTARCGRIVHNLIVSGSNSL